MYNVGDLVIPIEISPGCDLMLECLNKVCTIENANNVYCQLKEDKYNFSWLNEWVIPANEKEITISDDEFNSLFE